VFLGQMADAAILVLEADRTDREHAKSTADLIRRNGGRLVGAVLNKRRR
jgi:Mrp family chromosome partitioning ATPase